MSCSVVFVFYYFFLYFDSLVSPCVLHIHFLFMLSCLFLSCQFHLCFTVSSALIVSHLCSHLCDPASRRNCICLTLSAGGRLFVAALAGSSTVHVSLSCFFFLSLFSVRFRFGKMPSRNTSVVANCRQSQERQRSEALMHNQILKVFHSSPPLILSR